MANLTSEGYASAAWSLIAEPGDEAAGLLRLTFGAESSLRILIDKESVSRTIAGLRQSSSWEAANLRFGNLEKTLSESFERWLPRVNQVAVDSALKLAKFTGIEFITLEHQDWPSSLMDLGLAAPAGLWVRGSLSKLNQPIAIVGSRAATSYGAWVCADLVSGVAEAGATVVSGGAFGIDAQAHTFANNLELANFAIMAGGVDRFYPATNSELLRKATTVGAVLSELPPGSKPTRWRFLQRNRLIACLGLATVVVEAGYRSGAINTANHAASLGRPVGAVPGPINSPSSEGCHRLIRDSVATLVSSPQDLLELAGIARQSENQSESMSTLELRTFDALTRRFQSLGQIATKGGLTNVELAIALGGLELSGRAERNSENCWRLRLNL